MTALEWAIRNWGKDAVDRLIEDHQKLVAEFLKHEFTRLGNKEKEEDRSCT